MSCTYCGLEGARGICNHHLYGMDEWARQNRIWCDFIHRGVPLPRVEDPEDRHRISPPEESPSYWPSDYGLTC